MKAKRSTDSETLPPAAPAAGEVAPAQDEDVVFAPGDMIAGQFEVVRFLGKGGLAAVYLVRDGLTGEEVALKTLRPSRLSLPGAKQCLAHEVAWAHRLRHPHIVPVYALRDVGPQRFFTMAYVRGKTLREVMLEPRIIGVEEAVALLRPVCLALEHVHDLMVHRDVSPENVMVGPDGVTLLDFGSVKPLDPEASVQQAMGKGHYAAPEQRDNSFTVDPRADLYPLGVMFFEMLTKQTFLKPLSGPLRFPGLSDEALALCSRSIVPLEQRYANVRDFRLALERCARMGAVVDFAEVQPAASPAGAAAAEPGLGAMNTPPQTVPISETDTPTSEVLDGAPRASREGRRTRFWRRAAWSAAALVVAVAALAPLAPPPTTRPRAPQSVSRWAYDAAAEAAGFSAQKLANWRSHGDKAVLALPGGAAMAFRKAAPGAFEMGYGQWKSVDASPAHEVRFARGFWMGACEVTQAQWEAMMGTRPWEGRPEADVAPGLPATYVCWDDAVAFVERLNTLNAGQFRLPTEAEWEYACRAGGAQLDKDAELEALNERAWFFAGAGQQRAGFAQAVGRKAPNAWGLFDMQGNVAEWCADWYSDSYYANSPAVDPQGPELGVMKVVRGGSWRDFATACASYVRNKQDPSAAASTIGFRVCRAP